MNHVVFTSAIEITRPIRKKITLLLVVFCSSAVNGYAQDEKRNWFDLEANLLIGTLRPYYGGFGPGAGANYSVYSQGGNAYGLVINNSFMFGKWFTDIDLNINMTFNYQKIVVDDNPNLVTVEPGHNLNFFSPFFSFGRFIRWNDKYRLSVGVGLGYSWLLPKEKTEYVQFWYNDDFEVTDVYEYDFDFYGRSSLGQATIGLYLPVGENELVVKVMGRPTGSVGGSVNFRKIVDYEAVELFDTYASLPQRMISLSVGYRFCGGKKK